MLSKHCLGRSVETYLFWKASLLQRGREAGTFETTVKFRRAPNDDLLNNVLRVLQERGAVIRSVETERATLLDVLESYEKEREDGVS